MSISEAIYAEVIDSIHKFYSSSVTRQQKALSELVPAIAENAAKSKEYNRLESCDFNLFHFFNPGETTHSRLLAFFLNPNGAHGQGNLFLKNFLLLLGIIEPEKGCWVVTAETGRIDVLIKRLHPHSVVIIENKSNLATDQANQLYRYWYQQIYQKQVEWHLPQKEKEFPPTDRYKIIYLVPAHWKQPDENSLCKPAGWENVEHLPPRIPIEPVQLLFSKLMVGWLSASLKQIPSTNYRLKEFAKQYIEFWRAA